MASTKKPQNIRLPEATHDRIAALVALLNERSRGLAPSFAHVVRAALDRGITEIETDLQNQALENGLAALGLHHENTLAGRPASRSRPVVIPAPIGVVK